VDRDFPFFPLWLNISGRKCLVVGAGRIAVAKIDGLLNHGAKVVVIAPGAVPSIKKQARKGLLTLHSRTFSPIDVKGAFLVVAATNSSEVNAAIFRACRAQRVLCNAVDDPENCDFFYPAVVRRGPLQIAISTNGQSPGLAARLRKQLEVQFGPEWSLWVEHTGKLRRKILGQKMSTKERRQRLLKLTSPAAFRSFLRKGIKQKTKNSKSAKRRSH
jgi:precorrin-2 dehydrogenase / sirohydrochlorin ferrochelatase